MTFVNLDAITEDLLRIVRGSEISDDEPISKRQLEHWVHTYRALLIKRDLEKKRIVSPEYMQEITGISVTETSPGSGLYSTDIVIPNVIYRKNDSGYVWIGSATEQYQLIPSIRAEYQGCKKYTSDYPYVYLIQDTLYTNRSDDMVIRGLFDDPMEAAAINNSSISTRDRYPIPASMIPTLKEMILGKELNIEYRSPSDEENNATHNIE